MVYHQRLRYLKLLQDEDAGIESENPRNLYSRTNPSFFDQTTDDEKDDIDQEEETHQGTALPSKMKVQVVEDAKRAPTSQSVPTPSARGRGRSVSEASSEAMDVVTEEVSQQEASEPFDPLSLLASASKKSAVSIDVLSILAFEAEAEEESKESALDKIDPLVDAKPFNELLSMQRTKITTATVSRPSLMFGRMKTKQEAALAQTAAALDSKSAKTIRPPDISNKPISTSVKAIVEQELKQTAPATIKPKVYMDDDNDDDDEEADFDHVDATATTKAKAAATAKSVLSVDTSTPKVVSAKASSSISVVSVSDVTSNYEEYDFSNNDQPQPFDHDSDEDSLDRFFATPAKAEPEEPYHASSSSKMSNQKAKSPMKRTAVDIDEEDFLDHDHTPSSSRKTLGKASRQSSSSSSSSQYDRSSTNVSSSKSVNKYQYDDNIEYPSSKRGRYSNAAENVAEVSLRRIPIKKRDLGWDDGDNTQGESQGNEDYNEATNAFDNQQAPLTPVAATTPRPTHTSVAVVDVKVPLIAPKPVVLKTNKFFSKPKVQQMVIRPMEAIPTGQLFYCINKFALLPAKPAGNTAYTRSYSTVDEKPLLSKSLHVIQELQLRRNDLKVFHKFTPDIFDRYATGCIIALKSNGSDTTRRLLVIDSKLKTIFQEHHQQAISTPVVDLCEVFEDPLREVLLDQLDDKAITAEEFEFLKIHMSPAILPIYNETFVNQKIMEMRFCRKFVSKMII